VWLWHFPMTYFLQGQYDPCPFCFVMPMPARVEHLSPARAVLIEPRDAAARVVCWWLVALSSLPVPCPRRPYLPPISFLLSSPLDLCSSLVKPTATLRCIKHNRRGAPKTLGQPAQAAAHKAREAQAPSRHCGVTRAIVLLGFAAQRTPSGSTLRSS
jgi:hypothetical protein